MIMITAVLPQTTVPIPAVLPSALSPLPRDYRGIRGNPVVPITVQLSNSNWIHQRYRPYCYNTAQPTGTHGGIRLCDVCKTTQVKSNVWSSHILHPRGIANRSLIRNDAIRRWKLLVVQPTERQRYECVMLISLLTTDILLHAIWRYTRLWNMIQDGQ